MPVDVIVPNDLWEEDEDAVVMAWFTASKALVRKGDLIAEIMVAKTQHEIVAPADGVITILKDIDEVVSKGTVIGSIESMA